MKKLILLLFCLFSMHQSFCEVDYLKIGKSCFYKTIGYCIYGIGVYGTYRTATYYVYAYDDHCRAKQELQKNSADKNTISRFIKWRNEQLLDGTVVLVPTVISLVLGYYLLKRN